MNSINKELSMCIFSARNASDKNKFKELVYYIINY